jgi:formate/nitrite transporter FocA (FNT family)
MAIRRTRIKQGKLRRSPLGFFLLLILGSFLLGLGMLLAVNAS